MCDFVEQAVEAITDAVVLFVGLEVDVGDAAVDRVQHHLLQISDYRCVVDVHRRCRGGRVNGFLVAELELEVIGLDGLEDAVLGHLGELLQPAPELVVLDHHGLDE